MARKSSTARVVGQINGFVLAGGQSRRMGRDKADLNWRNETLLEHTVRILSLVAGQVRVVGRGENPDRIPGLGPLGGILTALEIANTDWNLILGVDLPLMTPDFLELLRERSLMSRHSLVACRVHELYPLCLTIHRKLLPTIRQRVADGKLAIHDLIDGVNAEILTADEIQRLGFDCALFSNINTPDDWNRFTREGATPR
jgi:molybdopterin-guanine dinucleotide biosynthesis protein A